MKILIIILMLIVPYSPTSKLSIDTLFYFFVLNICIYFVLYFMLYRVMLYWGFLFCSVVTLRAVKCAFKENVLLLLTLLNG